MKKILYTLILLLFIIPIKVNAREGISNYYIDATILSNGDVNIKEIFTLSGSYNGMNRIINFGGNYKKFDGTIESFKGSDIYNGDSIKINSIKGISYSNQISKEDLNKEGDLFEEKDYASKGEYGVYTKNETSIGTDLLIYNPSKEKKAFYIDYTITNMAIVHNDIAELGLNVFTELTEYVDNLELYIHIPNNKDLMRVWAHGPLWGESKIIDNNTVKITIQNLETSTPIDVRLAFDKSVLTSSLKKSNTDALNKIIELETKQADIANQEREQARQEVKANEQKLFIYNIFKILWLIGIGIIFYFVYKKYDKEYASDFKTKYFRDFPSDNSPTNVGYLIRKKITNDDLSASILMLIYKKALTFEEVPNKKNDYTFKYNSNIVLDTHEQKLVEFLFNKSYEAIKEEDQMTLSKLKNQASSKYESFLKKYNIWKNSVDNEAISKNFYENNSKVKLFAILYSVVGLSISRIGLMHVSNGFSETLAIALTITSVISLIYFIVFKKRTKAANNEYVRWIGLKNFMQDFGTIDKKQLPEIVLWEKYLVYAVSLGCAETLAKTMKIRAEEFTEMTSSDLLFDYYRFNAFLTFNRIIHNNMNTAISNAYQARSIANSSDSSGGGFGGGFSGGFGGGGSFGGGGGGGRF